MNIIIYYNYNKLCRTSIFNCYMVLCHCNDIMYNKSTKLINKNITDNTLFSTQCSDPIHKKIYC